MSTPSRVLVELRKLARVLDVDEESVAFLAAVGEADLRVLRGQVGEALFQADRPALVRVAALSKALPGPIAAKLAEAVLPPLIAARTSELLEPPRAADLVKRISVRYLADVSLYLDAARAPEVIAAIPAAKVAEVAAELARRAEWIVIGGFVAQVGKEALAASVARFNGEQLLRIGFVLDDLTKLDDIGDMLTERQLDELLAAAAEHGLWTELSDLVAHLPAPHVARLAVRYAAQSELHERYEEARDAGALPPATLAELTP